MIDPKELRIGNWVHHNSNWSYRNEKVGPDFNFEFEEQDWYWISECRLSLDDLDPIALTPELLEKCGFENKYNEYVLGNLEFRKQQNDLILNGFEYDYNGVILNRPQYLHQLQNLYFALTGEELTVNI